MQDVLSSSTILDHTSLSDLDGTRVGRLGEDRVSNNRIDKVGRGGSGVGSGNGSLLHTVSSEVGLSEVLGDLCFQGVGQVSLYVSKIKMNGALDSP